MASTPPPIPITRHNVDAAYKQHLINGYTSAQAYDKAISGLGGKFSYFKVGSDGEIETTSAFDANEAAIKKYQADYDKWEESGSVNAINDANAKTISSTTASSNIVEDEQTTGGGYTDTKTNYVSTDTPESLAFKAKAATIKEQEDALKDSFKGSGYSTFNHPDYPKLKKLRDERKALELAEERTQTHTTTQSTSYFDANGDEITESEYTVSHTANPETGAIENVQVGNPIKPVQLTQADADRLNAEALAEGGYAPRTLEDLQDEANDDAYLASLPTYNGIQFQNQQALDEYKANNVTGDLKTERDTFVNTNTAQNDANQAANAAQDAQNEANAYLANGDMEGYATAKAEADKLTATADGLQSDIDATQAIADEDELDTLMMQAEFDQENLDDEYASRPEPSVADLRKQINKSDWRVRLRLAPQSDYLYNAMDPGILKPLAETDGVLFPYMPRIDQAYHANYSSYDLTHSNYRGYFYKNSYVGETLINATFTAQDTREANYLLAVIHFFRSATKMFYGQDELNGTPPPLVFLTGLGDYQFNEHPCAITLFNYNLPNDVDYIKAGNPNANTSNFMQPLKPNSPTGNAKWSSRISRLFSSGLSTGGNERPTYTSENIFKASEDGITYIPTKIDITFQLIPIQTRAQVSNKFSLKDYASGNLVKKGFY